MVSFRWPYIALLAAALGLGGGVGCASDEDPFDPQGPQSCAPLDQNKWIYRLMQEVYLWSDDLPVVDPSAYDDPRDLLADLRVPPDRWSRLSDKSRSNALFEEGKVVGTGFQTRLDGDDRLRIVDVTPDSPADQAGLMRGDRIESINGLTIEQINTQRAWGEIYGPNEPRVGVTLEVSRGPGEAKPIALVKDWITLRPVPIEQVLMTPTGAVGYLQLTTFVEPAITPLDDAFATFAAAGVRRVIVDLRYNGGGLVSVARHFINLLVGAVAEANIAYEVRYNDTLSGDNIQRPITRVDHSLPAIDQVVFITTRSSISASELLINAVAAHVPVSVVGDTTGGKPVGSRRFEVCASVLTPITFQIVNADGYGGYFEGIEPDCPAPDDFDRPLGAPDEASLATALHRLETGECRKWAAPKGRIAGPVGDPLEPYPRAESLF